MRAIVVGAGDVGYDVARMLSLQRHDVTVIDVDPEKVAYVSETLDVLAITGSGTSAAVLEQARIREADLLVAVTDVDEVNIIASMLAEHLGKSSADTTTIARVRSGDFTGENAVLTLNDFGIDHLIHPEESTAAEVVALLRRAAATDLVEFCDGRLQLVGVRLDEDASVAGETLQDLARRGDHLQFRVMAIVRGSRTIVPDGSVTLQPNDQVFVLAPKGQVGQVSFLLGKEAGRLKHAMILGGSAVGARVAAGLSSSGRGRDAHSMQVKLVEADRERAELLAEKLEHVLIIHGDPSDIDLLVREGLSETDALVAVTQDEESNLVSCLMAKHLGVKKTVALLSKGAYIPISRSIGLDAAVSQKLAVSREVLRFLRGKHVQSVATVHGLDAEILELEAEPGAPITTGPLKDQKLPRGLLVGAVVGKDVEIATGQTRLVPGSRAIVFATPDRITETEAFFRANGRG